MTYSYQTFNGGAAGISLAVSIPFLLRAHVSLYTDYDQYVGTYDALLVEGADYNWVSDTLITTLASTVGRVITVKRKTPTTGLLVGWTDGSNVDMDDLLTSDRQNLYAVQEQEDASSLVVATAGLALSQVVASLPYAPVATVAAIPATPTNGQRIEIGDSAGIQSFSPLAGRPSGFVGASNLIVRLVYTTTGNTWQWVDYRPRDPDGRYGTIASVTAASTAAAAAQTTANTANTAAAAAQTTANTANAAAAAAQSFTQAGAGAVARTVESKLRDVVSVKDFGAVGDGVADDTAAIQAALSSNRVSLYIPSGRYRITSNLTRSGHTYLCGDGLGSSVFVFNGTSGLVYSGGSGADNYDMKHFVLERLAFECIGINSGALLDAQWTDGIGGTSKSIVIRDCDFTGTDASGGFAHGIRLTNARNVRIDNVRVAGDRDALPITSGNALTLVGSNPDGAPAEIFIDAFQAFYCQTGIDVSGWVEGIYLNKSSLIACRKGLKTSMSPAGRPLLVASGNHFANDENGILCSGFVQTRISSNSFYCLNVSGLSSVYAGIQMEANGGKGDNVIAANDFQAIYDPGTTYGIVIANDTSYLENTVITDNTLSGLDVAIQLNAGTAGVKVTDSNIFYNCGINNESSNGNNIVEVGSYASGGSSRTFGDGLAVKFGSSVISTDASGNGTITFETAFPNSILTAFANNGDQAAFGAAAFCINSLSASVISFSVRPNPGSQVVRVNWVAFGN